HIEARVYSPSSATCFFKNLFSAVASWSPHVLKVCFLLSFAVPQNVIKQKLPHQQARIYFTILGYIKPNMQDFQLTDVGMVELKNDISQALEVQYLSPAVFPSTFPVKGRIFGLWETQRG
ncbi:hypothetical protein ROZALSC1DRAFT_24880, partial [Rozella allomycis CSF55]